MEECLDFYKSSNSPELPSEFAGPYGTGAKGEKLWCHISACALNKRAICWYMCVWGWRTTLTCVYSSCNSGSMYKALGLVNLEKTLRCAMSCLQKSIICIETEINSNHVHLCIVTLSVSWILRYQASLARNQIRIFANTQLGGTSRWIPQQTQSTVEVVPLARWMQETEPISNI